MAKQRQSKGKAKAKQGEAKAKQGEAKHMLSGHHRGYLAGANLAGDFCGGKSAW